MLVSDNTSYIWYNVVCKKIARFEQKKGTQEQTTVKIYTLVTSGYRSSQGYTMQDLIIKKPEKMNTVGAPPMYTDPLEMQRVCDKYFSWCDSQTKTITRNKNEKIIYKPYTVSGLTLALGFASVQSLLDYEKKPQFADIIKRAKLRVQNWTEEKATNGEINPIYAMFTLKCNFGFVEKQEVNFTGNLALSTVLKSVEGKEY